MDVIATIWKKPYYTDRNQRMIDAGVDFFRIKCSHVGTDEIANVLAEARKQVDSSMRKVGLLVDLPEAKIRLGEFPQEGAIPVAAGTSFHFRLGESSPGPEDFIPVRFAELAKYITVGDEFYCGDGILLFRVTEIIDSNHFIAVAQNNSRLLHRSSLMFPKLADTLDHITPVLSEIIKILPDSRPEMVAFSFVKSQAMLEQLCRLLEPVLTDDWHPRIISKIETAEGVRNIDEILASCDGIMIARGDLGINIPFTELGVVQKRLVKKARDQKKYVIVATQMLQSLLDNYIPMRSDILDVTNACLDGASAVMLCAETAHSEFPERAVSIAKRIIDVCIAEAE
jgi:pyruvate kinase